jgi:prepilin-type processing-associated H-X9-DG protein
VDSVNKTKPRLREYFENNANWKDGINDPVHQEVCIDWTPFEPDQPATSYRHYKKLGYTKEGSNVLFLDGRVEFVPANPTDIIFETGFEFFEGADPNDATVKDRYWIRWIARKY